MPEPKSPTPESGIEEMLADATPGEGDQVVAETDGMEEMFSSPEGYNAFEESMQREQAKMPDPELETKTAEEPPAETGTETAPVEKETKTEEPPKETKAEEPGKEPTGEEGPSAEAIAEAVKKFVGEKTLPTPGAEEMPEALKKLAPEPGRPAPETQTQEQKPQPAAAPVETDAQLDFSKVKTAIVEKYGADAEEAGEMIAAGIQPIFEQAAPIVEAIANRAVEIAFARREEDVNHARSSTAAFYESYPDLKTPEGRELVSMNFRDLQRFPDFQKADRGQQLYVLGKRCMDQLASIKTALGGGAQTRKGTEGEALGSSRGRQVKQPGAGKAPAKTGNGQDASLDDMISYAEDLAVEQGHYGHVN